MSIISRPASCCALAEGVGEKLTPLPPLESLVVVSKPKISVSTKIVYQGMDKIFIEDRPDVDAIAAGLRGHDREKVESNMGNVLELYTLKEYNSVLYTKCRMAGTKNIGKVLMSGSGPSVYGLFTSRRDAQDAYEVMEGKENDIGVQSLFFSTVLSMGTLLLWIFAISQLLY